MEGSYRLISNDADSLGDQEFSSLGEDGVDTRRVTQAPAVEAYRPEMGGGYISNCDNAIPHVKRPTAWYLRGSLLLENKASVARDHLASERTYLAWLRTSLSLASVGVGITQLLKLGEETQTRTVMLTLSKGLGLCFILVAIMTLSIGTVRYFAIQDLLLRKEYPVSRLGVSSVFICVTVLTLVTMSVVLAM